MRCVLMASAALLLMGAAHVHKPAPFGFDMAGRDTAIKPGDDFFGYANGTYIRNLQIPPDRTNYGSFIMLADLSEQRVHDILDRAAAHPAANPGDTGAKLGAFYASFLDEAAVEHAGAAPLAADLALVRGVNNAADFARLNGLATKTMLGAVIDVGISPDSKDPTRYTITLQQSGLGMPDRDYYLAPAFAGKKAQYQNYAAAALKLAGWPDPDGAAARVMALETQIAQASWSRAESRDDDKTYNPIASSALPGYAPGFDWGAYFAAADLGAPATVVLGQNSAIARIAAIVGHAPIGTLRDWAALHLVINASPVLAQDFDKAHFDFFSHALQGQPQQRPRWKRAVAATEMAMGDAVGRIYADRYYPAVAREKMQALTADLRAAFRVRLEHNDWMTPATRQKALEKLGTFYFQIGAPKRYRDYAALRVGHDLYGNVERSTAFEWAFWTGHLGHPVDRDQWEMFPQTVNAYNEPLLNEVVFPAAILQPPFFDPHADPAINYGGIGAVIGHEMTHSFDDQGRKHDAQGRLTDWWTPADVAAFDQRAKRYGAQFAAMSVPDLPGVHINPDLTMGENIADLGGLTLALEAYHASLHGRPAPVIDGTTGDQRVFLGWAQVWRGKVRPDAARQRLTVDPHAPPNARANGAAHNLDAWYTAFAVQPGQALYLPPADRVKIW